MSQWSRRAFTVLDDNVLLRQMLISQQINDESMNSSKFSIPTHFNQKGDVMDVWNKSEAYYLIFHFILALNLAIRSKPASKNSSSKCKLNISFLVEMLDSIEKMALEQQLAIASSGRYGNAAFRELMNAMPHVVRSFLQSNIKDIDDRFLNELMIYIQDSFGHIVRLDYGTLHELHFFCFLYACFVGKLFDYDDFMDVVHYVVYKYYRVSNDIIKRFSLEPAGNLGFLLPDQYQFISFLLGSSELIGESIITPTDSVPFHRHNDDYNFFLRSNAEDYFYFETLLNATKDKSGPFCEHSKFLWDVSRIESWGKINKGLLNMLLLEVLQRKPMIQHFLFGSLLSSKPRKFKFSNEDNISSKVNK